MRITEITGRELISAPTLPPIKGRPSVAGTILLKIVNQIDPDVEDWHIPPSGVEGAVAVHMHTQTAYKVFWARSAYTQFIQMVAKNRSKHWPRISAYKPNFNGGPWSVVRMEALHGMDDAYLGSHYLPEISYLIMASAKKHIGMHKNTMGIADEHLKALPNISRKLLGFIPAGNRAQTVIDAAQQAPDAWKQAVDQLLNFAKQTGHTFLDLHSGNFMNRDNGTLVITDPFVQFGDSD
jgi:hypothetical protein